MRKLLLILVVCLACLNLYAQQKDPNAIGEIKGVVRDSLHNFSLNAATIAIYNKADSSLVVYQLANRLGEFSAKNIPIGKPLFADFTYLGYKGERRNFTLKAANKVLDFKNVNLSNKDIVLKEVQIKPPPVRMNKDTLEFFADAYTLEKSATVEDLIRKLSGLTVWGDGSITYNGKAINNLTVNGKPFFGGDLKVATQNLPKNIVEKIQVFNKASENNPLDSTLQMNVKLKKGMNKGLFGKVGLGYGTDKRYGADASLNYFNDKMQIALIGAANNTNKTANSVSQLQQNASFKGEGTSVAYNPDFRQQGINRQYASGAQFQYDFLKVRKVIEDADLLTGDYFISKIFNEVQRASTTDRVVPQSADTRKLDNSSNNTVSNRQNLSFNYTLNNSKNSLSVRPRINRNSSESNSSSISSVTTQDGLPQSNASARNLGANTYQFYGVTGGYNLKSPMGSSTSLLKPTFNLSFDISTDESKNDRTNMTDFNSLTDPAQNRSYNRKYQTSVRNSKEMFELQSMPLQQLVFGRYDRSGINMTLRNRLDLNQYKADDRVSDFDVPTNRYQTNNYLTNRTNYNLLNDTYGLNLSRYYELSALEGRYQKTMSVNVALHGQFLKQDNRADQKVQNIGRKYNAFIPSANISYSNQQNGSHSNQYTLEYKTRIEIPEISQMAPLVDSTNVFSFPLGNLNLKESYHHEVVMSFGHNPNKASKGLNYGFNLSYTAINNMITDSIFYDQQGRRTNYFVNANGYQSLGVSGRSTKSFKLADHQLQFRLTASYSYSQRPNYIDGFKNMVQSHSGKVDLNAGYTFKDKLFLDFSQGISNSSSKNVGSANLNSFGNLRLSTSSSLSVPVFNGLTVNTNITYENFKPTNSKAINFSIWNATLIQRFTEEKNIELRLSALDLLRQNKSISVFNDGSTLSTTNVSTLTQYFMISVAYFPRKFGAKK
ncbi:outer membrane beta-barrel protein [Pedobacter frigoris]|uniref:Uncharacterized protein n=1 Tax=Pedobacter frigoris TaxID=2571272 RepID=A0A4U1CNX3_9SPHI|nr:outer membrane beta-barrel protein [Pedobacter frigoris]TKC09163.1 hypothetical protein FA047_03450 [Pedobacter frigoris]